MPQYDGSVRFNTEINIKSAEAQLGTLENRIVKSAYKIDSLRSKLDLTKNIKIPTEEYVTLRKELETSEKKLDSFYANVRKIEKAAGMVSPIAIKESKKEILELEETIKKVTFEMNRSKRGSSDFRKASAELSEYQKKLDEATEKLKSQIATNQKIKNSAPYKNAIAQIDIYKNKIIELNNQIESLETSEKAFTIGKPEETAELEKQIIREESALDLMIEKRELLQSKIQEQAEEEQRLAQIKENATVADQKLVDLLEQRRQLLAQIRDMEKAGVTEGYAEYDTSLFDLYKVQSQIKEIQKVRDANMQARASFKSMGEVARETFKTMARGFIDIPIVAVKSGVNGLINGFRSLGNVAKNVVAKSFQILGNAIKTSLSKAGSLIGSMISGLKNLASAAKKSFGAVSDSANKSNGAIGLSLKNILKYGFGIRSLYVLVNKIRSAIKEGFGNLYKDNERFQSSVDNLKASILTLKNAFAAAFRPIVEVAIPYIQMAADKLTELLNKVGQFTAAITGQTSYTKAIKQTADAFKDAKKAAEGYLSPLDEINKFSTKKDETEQTGIMFEEVPIEQKFKDMAEKVKNVFKDLFAPIKEAWNREGEFVIDSWKYGLGEVKKLLADIGRDFLEVWKQPATIAMLQDILHIFGDIGLIVGNLAAKFREAWNENNVGLHILENIRDIFAVIVHNIREAADYTVEWTKTLDFTPLLQVIERLTASLVPFFDFLSGTLADFYTDFLLPLASWTLSEQGIPRLLNVLADFMESVDWKGLRDALKELYGALEPYAEKIGTGLIDFIERMKEYGVDFLNFLPEHLNAAANALRSGDLKTAFEEFGTITGEAVKNAFNFIKETIQSINWGEIGTLIASFINGIDWQGIGDALFGSFVAVINGAINLVYNFITTVNWRGLGESLGKSLSDALISIDWAAAGRTVGEAFKAFFNFIAETIENIDWQGLGEKVKEFIVNVDWAGVAEAFFEALGSGIGGLAAFLIGLISEAWQSVVDWWHEVAYKDGEFTIQGLLDGILEALKNIGSWIKEHVFEPFMEGFRKAFQIHSPSKAMESIGQYIIEGLLNGLKNMWSSITSWIEDKVNWIIDKFKSVKDKVSGFFSGGGSGDSGQSNSGKSFSMRSMMSTYSTNPAFATLAAAPIPKLATGAVIPPNKEFLAVLGDQKNGTNIEAPLDTIKQANRESLMEVMSELGLFGGGSNDGNTYNVKAVANGKVIFEMIIEEGMKALISSGRNPFDLQIGTT